MKLSTPTINAFLKIGGWSTNADDNISGETIPNTFYKEIFDNYQSNPDDPAHQAAVGLFPLGLSIAGWGMEDSSQLPPDPDDRGWEGTKSTGSGKHLMSYAKGGIGLPHADSSFLKNIFDLIESRYPELAPKPDRFFKLKGTNFDKLYANGGHCAEPTNVIMTDLNGEKFKHTKWGYAGSRYCSTYNTGKTNREDWRIFRHWMRDALRKKAVQNYILNYWIEHYWEPSYEKTMQDGGTIPMAMINARIRNSGSALANRVVDEDIQTQLEKYKKKSRWGVMLRSANLWEAFDGKPLSVRPGDAPSTWSGSSASDTSVTVSVPTDVTDTGDSSSTTITIEQPTATVEVTVEVKPKEEGASTSNTGGTSNNEPTPVPNGEVVATVSRKGKVTASALNIRSGPSSRYAKVARALKRGSIVDILEINAENWMRVKSEKGNTGWVFGKYIELLPTS